MANYHIVSPARQIASARAVLALVLFFPVAGFSAGSPSPWRIWNKADGMPESWTFGLTLNAEGGVVVKHGDVATESILDGYRIAGIPGQKAFGLFPGSSDHDLWTFDPEGILIYDNSGWHKYPVREIAEFAKSSQMRRIAGFVYPIARFRTTERDMRMDVLPIGGGHGMLVFPDGLVDWSRKTGNTRVVQVAAQTGLGAFFDAKAWHGGQILVAGKKGLAVLRPTARGFDWKEIPVPAQYSRFESPVGGAGDEIFVSALRSDRRRAVIDFRGGTWEEVFTGDQEALRGWRAQDGSVWIQHSEAVSQLNNMSTAAGAPQTYPGLVMDVLNEPSGRFWIGTSEGIARYSPPLWRTPPEAAWATVPVKAIASDAHGRTWFLSGKFLGVNDHEHWRRYSLPAGRKASLLLDNIIVLESGELVMRADSRSDILLFDPKTEKFRSVQHPRGRTTGMMAVRRAGGVWVQVFEEDGVNWRLEYFDGEKFTGTGPDQVFTQATVRAILEARNGDFWIGSAGALGLLRAGKFRLIGTPEGFTDTGVFSAIESPGGHIFLGGRDSVTEYDGRHFQVIRNLDLAASMCMADDGTLWTASGSGVHRYRPGQWITNAVEDGLSSTSVQEVNCGLGHVWVGTSLGLSVYFPMADTDPPIARISDDQNLRETPPGGEARMVFSGVDRWKFTEPNRLTFSWRVDTSPWSEFTPSHLASPRGLRSGAHRFEVKAMDRNGNISPEPAVFRFTVLLPWYLQRSFLIFTTAGLFIIGYLGRLAWHHHRRLTFQSSHDSLTALANRTAFESNLQHAITDAQASGTGVAMILLDLDRFKPINDTLGHIVGDRFLQEVSRRLRSAARSGDTLARLGGDEFAIVMPELKHRAEADAMAQKILTLLRQPYHIDSFELTGSASIGVSIFPEHGDDIATLQRLADMAMYQCKAQNKDEYAIFDPEVNRLDFRSAQMAGLIRSALDSGYLRLHYQPLKAADERLVGFEALVRLDHPKFGMIPPSDFIPIAEDTGLIIRVGDWVLAEACRQMEEWHAQGHRELRVNVNVSTVQLTKPDFAEKVRAIVGASGLDPRALTLEITETAIMRNLDESLAQIQRLRAMGITIALDDFGTGYSTLSSLYRLPIDYIKIDRCFVQRLDESGDGYTVIEAIANLVDKFGFEVVAEGVESQGQLAGLKSIGCDFFQGYLLGRPVAADKAAELLGSGVESRELELALV